MTDARSRTPSRVERTNKRAGDRAIKAGTFVSGFFFLFCGLSIYYSAYIATPITSYITSYI